MHWRVFNDQQLSGPAEMNYPEKNLKANIRTNVEILTFSRIWRKFLEHTGFYLQIAAKFGCLITY